MMKRSLKKEDGQMSLAVLLLAMAVFAVGLGLVVLGQASDVRGKAQKAADAGALAAAEEVKDQWIMAWLTQPGFPLVIRDWDYFAPGVSNGGGLAAESYAQMNSSSTVSNHQGARVAHRTIEITVDTDSETVQAQGPAADMVDDIQGSATATAQISMHPGVNCRLTDEELEDDDDDDDDDEQDQDPELESGTLRCSGAGISPVSVDFDGDGPLLSLDPNAFNHLFDIKLIN